MNKIIRKGFMEEVIELNNRKRKLVDTQRGTIKRNYSKEWRHTGGNYEQFRIIIK